MKRVLFAVFLLILFGACNPKQSKLKNNIDAKEKELLAKAKENNIDTAILNSLLNDYETYAEKYPEDTIGATYLFKAADFYRYLHRPHQSVKLYAKIYEKYPTAAKRPYALFLQGFISENEVGDIPAAKELYEKFLKAHPEHPIAKDVEISLSNLGKTPEQLLQEFQQKAQEDSLVQAGK